MCRWSHSYSSEAGESPSLGQIQLGGLSSKPLGFIYLICSELESQVQSTNPLGLAFYTTTEPNLVLMPMWVVLYRLRHPPQSQIHISK